MIKKSGLTILILLFLGANGILAFLFNAWQFTFPLLIGGIMMLYGMFLFGLTID